MSVTRIYVVDPEWRDDSVRFWAIDVIEMPKTYKVIKAYAYVGDGMGREDDSLMLLRAYRKDDRRVFLDFDAARGRAVAAMEKIIAEMEETLKRTRNFWKCGIVEKENIMDIRKILNLMAKKYPSNPDSGMYPVLF